MKFAVAYKQGIQSPKFVLLAALVVAYGWVWLTCVYYFENGTTASTCQKDCRKALFSAFLMFGLIFASWAGWNWDLGLFERLWELPEKEEGYEGGKARGLEGMD